MTTPQVQQDTTNTPRLNPFIEVILSRPSFRVGEPVVGTIRLVPNPEDNNNVESSLDPRQIFSDTYLFLAGWCRLDPRWHRASEYAKQYEHPAVHDNLQNRRMAHSNVIVDEHCVCFWTTSVLNLMELQERTVGQWEDVKPKPIGKQPTENGTTISSSSSPLQQGLQQQQLTFTFRANLPNHLPHSVQANSCRYFYAVVVGTRVKLPQARRKQWMRHSAPLHVLSLRPNHPVLEQSTGPTVYPMGDCSAMAHSAGLSCHVSATELAQPTGQILVHKRPHHHHAAATAPQTMRITDLQGIPCCVLTVMGISTATPGSRLELKLDFPIRGAKWTPCYQVCASLEGEEIVRMGGKRAQAYQLDTAYAEVDPDCTERVCLSLKVPLDAPITIQTDIIEISVKCILDITVGSTSTTTANDNKVSFSNLRLELPCRIVHPVSEYESILGGETIDGDDDAYQKLPIDELILGRSYRTGGDEQYSDDPPLIETTALRNTQDATHPNSFVTNDIRQDLKVLSLRMAQECNLI